MYLISSKQTSTCPGQFSACPGQNALALVTRRALVSLTALLFHYNNVIMGAIAPQITSPTTVYSIVYSDADQRKHQSSTSLTSVWGIHRGPVNSPHKWPVTRKMCAVCNNMLHMKSWIYDAVKIISKLDCSQILHQYVVPFSIKKYYFEPL